MAHRNSVIFSRQRWICAIQVLVVLLGRVYALQAQSPASSSVSSSASSPATATPQAQLRYDFSSVERLLTDSLAQFEGGCALLLIKDGEVVYEKTFGKHSLDAPLPIASASKWFAGAVLVSLMDDGLLSPNDTVRKFLPYFIGEKSCITVRQLMSHTSGMFGELSAMRNTALTLKQAALTLGNEQLLYKPGTAFLYGGASMQIAGRVMEIAAGQVPWEMLFQERIAKPLGLVKTTFYGLGTTQNPLLAGGAQSSAREYAVFLQMLVNRGVWQGKRILSEQAVAELHRNSTPAVPVMTYSNYVLLPKQPSEAANYGLGVWRVVNAQTGELIELHSQGKWGFTPWIDLRCNMIGILSTKSTLRAMMPTYRRLKTMLRFIIPPTLQTAHK